MKEFRAMEIIRQNQRERVAKFRRGKRCSMLWYRPEEYDLVKRASQIVDRPMTRFAILATLKAAREVIDSTADPCVKPLPRKAR